MRKDNFHVWCEWRDIYLISDIQQIGENGFIKAIFGSTVPRANIRFYDFIGTVSVCRYLSSDIVPNIATKLVGRPMILLWIGVCILFTNNIFFLNIELNDWALYK